MTMHKPKQPSQTRVIRVSWTFRPQNCCGLNLQDSTALYDLIETSDSLNEYMYSLFLQNTLKVQGIEDNILCENLLFLNVALDFCVSAAVPFLFRP